MKRLVNFFGSRPASISFLLFAIANRIIFTTLYSTVGRDTQVQITYAENLLAGKGMGVIKFFTTDLNTPVFDTYWFFPPGLSIVIIPFLEIFDHEVYKSILAFDIIAAILFIIAVKMLGKKSGLPSHINNIIVLIAGCSQYPFFMSSSSTDVISLDLVLFGLAGTINIINQKKKLKLVAIACYSFLFFVPAFFRYMYLPVSIILPALILLCGSFRKNEPLKVSGIKLLVGTISFLAILLSITSSYSGSAVHVYNTGRGVFFEQVTRWYPFLPASVINLDFAAQFIARISVLGYSRAINLLEIINVILFFLLCFLFFRFVLRHKKDCFSNKSLLITAGSIISFLIIILLAYLSLTYKAQDWGEYKWTYTYEVRYFAFIYIFIPVLLFSSVYFYPNSFKNIFLRFFLLSLMFGFLLECAHGVYYNVKIVANHNSLNIIRDRDKDYRSFRQILQRLKDQNPEREIIVSAPDQFYLHTASQMGYKSVFDYVNLNKVDLAPTAKGILLIPIHKQDTWIMKDYIEKNKPQVVTVIAGTTFYRQEIDSR